MAKAVAATQPAKVTGVTMNLSREEALTLWHLTRRVQESPNRRHQTPTVKSITNDIRDALAVAFSGDVGWANMSSVEVFGGQCTARTDSMDYVDPARPGYNPPF